MDIPHRTAHITLLEAAAAEAVPAVVVCTDQNHVVSCCANFAAGISIDRLQQRSNASKGKTVQQQ